MQLLHQLAGMPNASGPLLQNSDLTKHALPMELMYSISTLIYFDISSKGNVMRINCLFFCFFRAQPFSYQNNQFPWTLGLYNPQTGSTMFPETTIPLRYVLLIFLLNFIVKKASSRFVHSLDHLFDSVRNNSIMIFTFWNHLELRRTKLKFQFEPNSTWPLYTCRTKPRRKEISDWCVPSFQAKFRTPMHIVSRNF